MFPEVASPYMPQLSLRRVLRAQPTPEVRDFPHAGKLV
jgi:hypothetical protein